MKIFVPVRAWAPSSRCWWGEAHLAEVCIWWCSVCKWFDGKKVAILRNQTNRHMRSALKLEAQGQQAACYSMFSGLWLVDKIKIEKIWCRKQTQTLFHSPILVHFFSVSHINVFTSRVHAISSVLTKAGFTRKTNAMLYQVFRPVVGGKK